MAITNNDVKLFESQRLTDEEDGGGRVTGRKVIDGNVNNLFQDISRIDRSMGDMALRKAFIGIGIDNNDTYLGSHLIGGPVKPWTLYCAFWQWQMLTVQNLFALSKTANKTMTLTLPNSRQFTVIFDRSNRAPTEAQQVMPVTYPDDDNQYLFTLRLLTFQSIWEAG